MKKFTALILALALLLMLTSPANAEPLFDAAIAMLNEPADDDVKVSCSYDGDRNTVTYIASIPDGVVGFAVKNGTDDDITAFRRTALQLAQAVKSTFEVTERPDVEINVGLYSSDDELIIVATPTIAQYQGDFLPWNDRSADYLDD